MDDADLASQQAEQILELQLRARKPTLKPRGQCYNCDENTTGVFCSAECRHDFEKRQRLNALR